MLPTLLLPLLAVPLSTAFPNAVQPLVPRATGPAPEDTYPDPLPCSGNCSSYQDQSIIRRRSDGKLFRFAFNEGGENSVMFRSNSSLGGPWEFVTDSVLSGTPDSPFGKRDSVWNPDVHYVNGRYVLFYTDHHSVDEPPPGPNDKANVTISWATSPSMDPGTWTDHGPIGILEKDRTYYSRIGANLLPTIDPPQLVWGSDRYGIYGVNLTFSTSPYNISLKPPKASQYNQLIAGETIAPLPGQPARNLTEGAFQYQHPTNGFFYIFFSVGVSQPAAGSPYNRFFRIEACRSTNPYYGFKSMVGGKIVDCLKPQNHSTGHVVLQSHGQHVKGTGGVGVFDDPEGPFIYYEYVDPTGPTTPAYNRKYGHNHLSFDSGWPVVVA